MAAGKRQVTSMENGQLLKILRHARKKVRTTLHGLRPSALHGRYTAHRILLNSIPKAGTHLLENALEQFPLLRNAGRKTITCWESLPDHAYKAVTSIGRGEFLNGHLTGLPELLEIVQTYQIKVLFVIRDPRDIAVSYYKYVTNIDKTHPMHEYFHSLKDDDERLTASIEKVGGKVTIGELLRRYEPWLNPEHAHTCRFEDLIGPAGGGNKEKQVKLLESVLRYLEISATEAEIETIAERTFSVKSSTFRQGRTGAWRKYFKPYHISLFKSVAGNELIRYGYEDSNDW